METPAYKVCPICKNKLRSSRFDRHMIQQHSNEEEKERTRKESLELVKCPKCVAMVQRRRLDRHLQKSHQVVDPPVLNHKNQKKFQPAPVKRTAREVARELRVAMQEGCPIKNKEIADYLKRNPYTEEVGKFGVPQDKYRYGFYGSRTMEYDIWRKGDKEG